MKKVAGNRLQVTKLTSILVVLLSITYFLQPIISFAHVVKSNDSIGAVLHIDPADDPVAGKESNIILEFKDIDNEFELSECDCKLVILEADKEIATIALQPVAENDKLSSITPFTFPEKNAYRLKITGTPKEEDHFPDFEISYDIRVSSQSEANNVKPEQPSWIAGHLIFLIGGGVIILLLMAGLVIQNRNKSLQE